MISFENVFIINFSRTRFTDPKFVLVTLSMQFYTRSEPYSQLTKIIQSFSVSAGVFRTLSDI